MPGQLKYPLFIWALAGIILLTAASLFYLNWNGFIEQGEVTFATVSYILFEGYPLYVDIDAAERYSIQHGPMIYLIIGSFMKLLGPGYLTAKLANVTALLITIIISWLWFSEVLGKKAALCLLGLECWFLMHWTYSYLCRPDSMMLLCVAVSMYIASQKKDRLWLILGTTLPLGVMINLKIHGALYFLPALALISCHLSRKDFLIIGALTIVLGGAPFLLPQISLENYLMWLSMSVSHGILFEKILAKILLLALLSAIPILIGIICGVNFRKLFRTINTGDKGKFYQTANNTAISSHHLFLLSLVIALIVPVIIGSKTGSGTNHLIPFIPVFFYIILMVSSYIKQKTGNLPEVVRKRGVIRASYIILAIVLIAVTVSGINGGKRTFLPILNAGNRQEIFQEIQLTQQKYAGETLAIGYGDAESFNKYRDFVPVPVFAGNPYLVDKVAIGDMRSSGIEIPPATIEKISEGTIRVWLIPVGTEPFTGGGFDEAFRQAFLDNYVLASRQAFFDVWIYKNSII